MTNCTSLLLTVTYLPVYYVFDIILLSDGSFSIDYLFYGETIDYLFSGDRPVKLVFYIVLTFPKPIPTDP
jgi:hypothetical protein